jgi:hypothetical protein
MPLVQQSDSMRLLRRATRRARQLQGGIMKSQQVHIDTAQPPEEWPPSNDGMEKALLELFSQHVVSARDRVVRRAYATLVEGQPYAHGRIHQRPFAALDDLHLSEAERDKIVDIVAVFVDEAMEQLLRLIGAVTNTVGEYDTVSYELSGQIKHHDLPTRIRYDAEALYAQWQQDLNKMLAGSEESSSIEADQDLPDEAEYPVTPIGRGEPMWFDYRKWLGKYCKFRRTARP